MVVVFTRDITDNLTSLVKKIDGKVSENSDKKMAAFVVLLSDDPDADEGKLKALAKKAGLKKTPLTIFEGTAGPRNYKIAEDAAVTVTMWKGKTTIASHAFAEGKLNAKGITTVVADTAKILK